MQITTVGLDLAERVFQVHGVDAGGRVVMRGKLQHGEVAAFSDAATQRVQVPIRLPENLHFRGGEGNLRRAGSRAGGSHLIV